MSEDLLSRKIREFEEFPFMVTAWDRRGRMIYRDRLPGRWGDGIRDMTRQLIKSLRSYNKEVEVWILCKLKIIDSGCLEDEKYTATAKGAGGNTK